MGQEDTTQAALAEIFARDADKSACQEINQGHEGISTGQPQFSRKFQECSALLLINTQDGVTLFKHTGPRAVETVFNGNRGVNFQEPYELFMDHAARHGKKILIQPVFGDLSCHGGNLAAQAEERGRKMGIEVQALDAIRVPSSAHYAWNMLYDPKRGEIITQHTNPDGEKAVPVYTRHRIESLHPELFTSSAAAMEDTLQRERALEKVREGIRNTADCGMHEELERTLTHARDTFGEKILHDLLEQPLGGFGNRDLRDLLQTEYARQIHGDSRIPVMGTLRCIDVATRFVSQDDATIPKYIFLFVKCAESCNSHESGDFATQKARNLIKKISDPETRQRLMRAIADARDIAQVSANKAERKKNHNINGIRKYLSDIAEGKASGSTPGILQQVMKRDKVSLEDIGATEESIEEAFRAGATARAREEARMPPPRPPTKHAPR